MLGTLRAYPQLQDEEGRKQVKQDETVSFSVSEIKDAEGRKHDYYVNAGYAIRTIREEFPELFYRELSFDIFRNMSWQAWQ
ncbi:hypothetical protein AAHA92_32187 [Salvia divinorum]|uniref:Uncharacterized protein n=1 Tax=Salvia divinorum TaxID=28513 RepID=A0ABD1FJZ3_SALDI